MMNPLDLVRLHGRDYVSENIEKFAGFSLAQLRFGHRRFDYATAEIAKLHHSQKKYGKGRGLLLIGPSGVGKSTLLAYYASNFPTIRSGKNIIVPVLLITLPSNASSNGLITAIFKGLNYPTNSKLEIGERTIKVAEILRLYQVEMLLIDESQHSYYSRTLQELRLVLDTLKVILNASKIACVLVGLNEAEEVVFTNVQITRRHSLKVEISRFLHDSEEDFAEFRAILKAYQAELPIQPEIPLHESNLARRFLIASDGILDNACKILSRSIEIAGLAGMKKLDNSVYSAAFRDVIWHLAPDNINPFKQDSVLRRLDKVGEPFYPWHLKHPIGSPLARRNLISPKGNRDE